MTTATDTERPAVPRDWLLGLGMVTVGVAAAASSYAGLQNLAIRTGWVPWLSWLLPLTVDAYAMTATRVWLAKSTRSQAARDWAKRNAIGAITVSVGGNAVDHATAAHVFAITWPLVVAVSAIPPIVLGLLVHLAHLRTQPAAVTEQHDTEAQPEQEAAAPPPEQDKDRQPDVKPKPRKQPARKPAARTVRSFPDLLAEARQATAGWADAELTAEKIRDAAHCSMANARALREALKSERAAGRPLHAIEDAPDTAGLDESEGEAA
ncbi:DUF2637 domain-containing protein [Streptomyces sp. NBC_01262]|uniref:DUF2637 domain-containing protein n=1 Tax=Streptomyces sp. NBC_01262 TaxID=2903803 RepID=UPI002E37552C|nr:DUF2637 domain-containing protein [Streptomyces sp. NBC_01262]